MGVENGSGEPSLSHNASSLYLTPSRLDHNPLRTEHLLPSFSLSSISASTRLDPSRSESRFFPQSLNDSVADSSPLSLGLQIRRYAYQSRRLLGRQKVRLLSARSLISTRLADLWFFLFLLQFRCFHLGRDLCEQRVRIRLPSSYSN